MAGATVKRPTRRVGGDRGCGEPPLDTPTSHVCREGPCSSPPSSTPSSTPTNIRGHSRIRHTCHHHQPHTPPGCHSSSSSSQRRGRHLPPNLHLLTILALSLFLVLPTAHARYTWTSGSAVIQGVSSVASSRNATVLYAAAHELTSASVYRSNNSGSTWTQLTTSPGSIGDVACSADGQVVVATVYYGYLWLSTNGGSTWTAKDPESTNGTSLFSRAVVSEDGAFIAVTTYGWLWFSSDKGATWSTRGSFQDLWTGIGMSADGYKLGACNEYDTYVSSDRGTSFSSQSVACSEVAVSESGVKMVAVLRSGTVYKSTDGGSSFTKLSTIKASNWTHVAMSNDATKILISDSDGSVYSSSDGGSAWTLQTNGTLTQSNWYKLLVSGDGSLALLADNTNSKVYTASLTSPTPSPTPAPTQAPTTATKTLSDDSDSKSSGKSKSGDALGIGLAVGVCVFVFGAAGFLVLRSGGGSKVGP